MAATQASATPRVEQVKKGPLLPVKPYIILINMVLDPFKAKYEQEVRVLENSVHAYRFCAILFLN